MFFKSRHSEGSEFFQLCLRLYSHVERILKELTGRTKFFTGAGLAFLFGDFRPKLFLLLPKFWSHL